MLRQRHELRDLTIARFLLPLLAAGCAGLLACSGGGGEPDPEPHRLEILVANVGNLDEVNGGPCPSAPYRGATCSVAQEEALAASIVRHAPDIVVLLEILDAELCDGHDVGEADHACTGYHARVPYQQLRRLTGEGYTLLSDGIAHYDGIALRSDRIAVAECAAGEACIGGADTPPHPPECATLGGITSVSRVQLTVDETPITFVFAHPFPARTAAQDPCRLAQYRQALEILPTGERNLIAGDFNYDPYRLDDSMETGNYWFERVGPGRPFQDLSSGADDPPTPTWGDVATLDYLLADFGEGECEVLGVDPGTERLDAPLATLDHRALRCQFRW